MGPCFNTVADKFVYKSPAQAGSRSMISRWGHKMSVESWNLRLWEMVGWWAGGGTGDDQGVGEGRKGEE